MPIHSTRIDATVSRFVGSGWGPELNSGRLAGLSLPPRAPGPPPVFSPNGPVGCDEAPIGGFRRRREGGVAKKRKPATDWRLLVAELGTVQRQLARLAAGPTSPPLWLLRRVEQRLAALTERIRAAAGVKEAPLFYAPKPPTGRKKKKG
jgi:hypothetical protein